MVSHSLRLVERGGEGCYFGLILELLEMVFVGYEASVKKNKKG